METGTDGLVGQVPGNLDQHCRPNTFPSFIHTRFSEFILDTYVILFLLSSHPTQCAGHYTGQHASCRPPHIANHPSRAAMTTAYGLGTYSIPVYHSRG